MTASTPAAPSERVLALVAQMTLDEKLAQIVGFWEGEEGDSVAPLQGELSSTGRLDDAIAHGLGHLTRVYGTNPHDPNERAKYLWMRQRQLMENTRLGIPALVHEEILTGLSAWKAATFPTPLAWGATGNTALIERMGELIGRSMKELGIHQGLAPVLDVVRDARWGRVEECIAEDPYLVGEVGVAYVKGVQSAGVHATLKHFVGYSSSKAGRNFAPVSIGPRELADVLMLPFEMAILDANARSVMHSYAEIDGVPVASSEELLTGVLRDQWGFDGTVVADYFGVAFLNILHDIAPDHADAARQALQAGVDIELPTGDAYLVPLKAAVEDGRVNEALVDRALIRALMQKEELGLLDADFTGEPPSGVDLDSPEHREVARLIAEQSIVLVSNDGTLPLPATGKKYAVIGPNADSYQALFGCYSFANHVLSQRPGVELGFDAPTFIEGFRAEFGDDIAVARGCNINDDDRSGFDEAVAAASAADTAVVVVGDLAGLFGRGTVGEGCDTDDLELPGVQRELVEAILDTGTPVVLVLVTGRPYAVKWAVERCAAVVQAFFPGEEGGSAMAGVLSGRVNPSGRLPVTLPRSAGAQPYTYLHPQLGGDGEVSNLLNSPAAVFGHGLSYTTFEYGALKVPSEVATDDAITASVTVTNTGERAGGHVVQLYARDPWASVTRPLAQLVGYARVELEPGESATVTFSVPTSRVAFTGRDLKRIVEPGELGLWCGDSATKEVEATTTLVGEVHEVSIHSPRLTTATISA